MSRLSRIIWGVLALVALGQCTDQSTPQAPVFTVGGAIVGLASPIVLASDTTTIVLTDYLQDAGMIDSMDVSGDGVIIIESSTSDEAMLVGKLIDGIGSLDLWVNQKVYSIPMKNAALAQVRYEIELPNAEEVALTGDFNGWNPIKTPLSQDNGKWFATLELYPGNYAYQVVVDEEWMLDPNCEEKRSNGMGGFNSILNVPFKNEDGLHVKTIDYQNGKLQLALNAKQQQVVVWLDNHILLREGAQEQFSISIPEVDSSRHFLRVWTGADGSVSNELRIPLDGNVPVTDYSDLSRNDKERVILYFMMVDRFANGDTTNDASVIDVRVADRANYQGGDLQGILERFRQGYFEDLGVNTLWVSPIVQNPEGAYQEFPEPRRYYSGYHGYWPVSFTKIDHRLGNEAVLDALVQESHQEGFNVILDFVANHVHQEHPYIKAHPDYKTDLLLPDGSRNIRIWDAHRLTTWFDDFLPTLDYSRPEVVETVSDSALYWIDRFDLDGFRHDATKHIPESFWRATTSKLKSLSASTAKNYFQVGETFGDRTLIQSYIGSGMMDGQFDFNVYFDARSVFQDTIVSFEVLASSLRSSLNIHGAQHLMCNITGNHDLPRFISYASKAIGYEEDEKAVGWERHIEVKDPVGYEKLKMLQTFITTIPGIPVIYYGDEIGMAGANDPDNRRMMRFDHLSDDERGVKEHVKRLLQTRKDHLALIYGDLEVVEVSKSTFVYRRSYLGDVVYVAFNNADETKTLTLPSNHAKKWKSSDASATLEVDEEVLTLTLPPFRSTILTTL